VIAYKIDIETPIAAGFEAWANLVPDTVWDVLQDTRRRFADDVLDELRYYPDKVKYPIQWKSDRQRRAFFASNGFGKGIPYQRSGALGRSWEFRINRTPQGGQIEIENVAPYARFVVGTLRRDTRAAARFQQPFHKNTGWPLASETNNYWTDAMQAHFEKTYMSSISEEPIFTRRAFTARLP
jgi:hypothetical protein